MHSNENKKNFFPVLGVRWNSPDMIWVPTKLNVVLKLFDADTDSANNRKKTDCVNTVTSSIKAKNECVFSTCNRWEKINCNWIEAFCKRTACIGFHSHKAKVDRNQIFWRYRFHIRFSSMWTGLFEINLCSKNSSLVRLNKYKCQSRGAFKFAPKVYFFYDCAKTATPILSTRAIANDTPSLQVCVCHNFENNEPTKYTGNEVFTWTWWYRFGFF